MFKLQRLEISGFKSFADHTEVVFTGSGITAVVGPNGCGKSNVSDAISWVLGEQRARSLRGGEMKDVIFQGSKNRKPGGMAEVVLHLVRDESTIDVADDELEDIDETLSNIDENAVAIEEIDVLDAASIETPESRATDEEADGEVETVKAAQVGSIQTVETKVRTKRHWRPRTFALDFAPGEAVSVTRRLYLSGESEYLLNGRSCRLRDITDLFSGTGLSGAHYAIIEQGRIGQILSAKPADRRSLIEEAAGISKFRARQRAAESRLESAKTNLGRISDIVSEVDKQVNSLRRQAAKTRRFKILQEEFRELLRRLYAAEGRYLHQLSAELSEQLQTALAQEQRLQSELIAKEEASRNTTRAARDAEERLAELRKTHSNNLLERDRAERDQVYKTDQITGLEKRREALTAQLIESEQRVFTLDAELQTLTESEQQQSEAYSGAESELRTAEEAFAVESRVLSAIEQQMERLRVDLMQHTGAVERFDEIARQLQNTIERLRQRVSVLELEGERAAETFAASRRQAEELQQNLAAEERKLAALNAEKSELIQAAETARETLRNAEVELRSLNEEHSAKRHRLSTLSELEERRAVYTPQVQKIFADEKKIGVKLAGVLADRIRVPEEAEAAVEAIFGPFLQAIVVESTADAKRLSAWLKANNIGRAAILVLPAGSAPKAAPSAGEGSTLGEMIGAAGELRDILNQLFPREMGARFVDDIANVGEQNGQAAVDASGDLLMGRLMIAGRQTSGAKNQSLLGFKRELVQLEGDCSRLRSAIDEVSARVGEAKAGVVDSESKMVDLQSLIIKVDRGIHGLQIQVRTAEEEIGRADRHRRVVMDEIEQIKREIESLVDKRQEAEDSRATAEAAIRDTSEKLDAVALELSSAKAKADAANNALAEKRTAAATSEERRRAARSALSRVEGEIVATEQRLVSLRAELTGTDERIQQLQHEIVGLNERIASAAKEIDSENDELSAALTAVSEARLLADRTSEELAELNRHAVEARNERAQVEVRQAQTLTELRNTNEKCVQELNVDLPELIERVQPQADMDLQAMRRNAEDLRQRLENFGAINMLALEELAEAEERYLFLTGQQKDIIDSIASTEEALREIKKRSRERFRAAFEAINANFVEFFQELFGGGRGEMTLLESDDILEAGIEVVAQPPGKRLQNIMLLSGGEKAMTAIALVLAIFKYRPSPFCLLDEVDAPLDEANVGRFAAKIAEMSEKTQFIVITHNKRTMEAARALYGVTMQEAGVSKVVSVKFE